MSEPSPDGEQPRYVAFELRRRGQATEYLVWDHRARRVVREASSLWQAQAEARWLNEPPPAPRRRARRARRQPESTA